MPQAPGFWYQSAGLASWLLSPLALAYRGASLAQAWLRGQGVYYAGVPVISVGNITVGGSGKTPLVEALAKHYAAKGHAVAVVGSGYGAHEKQWPVRVEPFNHSAWQVGDEALMLARSLRHASVVVWIAASRQVAVRRAEEAGATLIILDDGFHRRDIARTADVVVVDGPRGFGNGFMLPAGPLREPVRGLKRASFAVVMDEPAGQLNQWYGVSAYRLTLTPEKWQIEALRGKRLVAFAGLGNPDKFFAMLRHYGLNVVEEVPFADHYEYGVRDVTDLNELAQRLNATLVTTAKDAAKLPQGFAEVVTVSARGADWTAIIADLDARMAKE
jgi:tetraacyldisaccharide 4'-kinase